MSKIRIRPFLILLLGVVFFTPANFSQSLVYYSPSAEVIFNPERGFYSHMESQAERTSLTLSGLMSVKAKGQSLILRMYYLKSFRNSDLSAKQLSIIAGDFDLIRKAGLKCILRFAYSQNIGEADAPLSRVLRHLEQLQPLIRANADIIAIMQTGFIGAWGEMHSSTNGLDSIPNARIIVNKILEVLPQSRMIQVRTPYFKKNIFSHPAPLSPEEAFSGTGVARTGHHNDCFLASDDDYGTYQDTASEKAYLNIECLYTPMGGETCNPCNYSECVNSMYEMARLHCSYLNMDYHPGVISGWQQFGCFNEISKKLGYRFELIQGSYSDSLKPGSAFQFNLKLTNNGYAPLFNPRNVEVILESGAGKKYVVKLPVDPRRWIPGTPVQLDYQIGLPENMPEGDYTIKLFLPDADSILRFRPEYSVRFANANCWEAATGFNLLNAIVRVNNNYRNVPYSGSLLFAPYNEPLGTNRGELKVKKHFGMISNYPNPFNSSTRISYSIGKSSNVQIRLYNAIGQELSLLLDEYKTSGYYEMDFDASRLGSGVYFYKLVSTDGQFTGKMLHLK